MHAMDSLLTRSVLGRLVTRRGIEFVARRVEDSPTLRSGARQSKCSYRDLRAGAASGWGLTPAAGLRDITRLASIRHTRRAVYRPSTMNAFLFKLETTMPNLLSGMKGAIRETEAAFRPEWPRTLGGRRSTPAICGMMRTAVSAIMTGGRDTAGAVFRRASPRPLTSRPATQDEQVQNALPMRCWAPHCSPRGDHGHRIRKR